MKKAIFILFQLILGNLFAQNSKSVSFTYQVNINYKENVIIEDYELLINGNKSYYYNPIVKQLDSIKNEYKRQNDLLGYQAARSNYPKQKLKYKIIKEMDSYHYELPALSNNLQYTEKLPKLDWKIFNVYDTIANYKCQKAETFYEGRKYTAWFTIEIPINNGPYIFQGLPGLITKVVREDTGYEIKLRGVKNQNNAFLPELATEKVIKVKKEEIIKADIGVVKTLFGNVEIADKTQEKYMNDKLEEKKSLLYLYEF